MVHVTCLILFDMTSCSKTSRERSTKEKEEFLVIPSENILTVQSQLHLMYSSSNFKPFCSFSTHVTVKHHQTAKHKKM